MTDNRMKDRVKVMFAGTSTDSETSEHAMVMPNAGGLPNQALHVLTLAQRTAEEHVAAAHQQADKIRTDALAAAEQIARDAQVHAHDVRREADKVLYDARAAAEQTAREAQAHAEEARRTADKILADARARAEAIAAEARANADHLRLQAQQRYDDVVGSLGTKREGLQQQIEALERFDHEYRARLTAFMQGQLRALWLDQPQVAGELPEPEEIEEPAAEAPEPEPEPEQDEEPAGAVIPAQRPAPEAETEAEPVGAHAAREN
jgi:cell division septum initiation protein DivIVA